jgi:hypothetical protein
MAHFSSDHFSGTVRTSKDEILHGPLSVRRLSVTPPNDFGRNGDIVIVDNTADESEKIAINRIPVSVQLCQKVPLLITAGTFTITTPAGVFPIVITSLDDVVAAINRANIPGFNASNDPRGNITINDIGSTWADGTSNFPSVAGNVGVQAGTYVIGMGTWECIVFSGTVSYAAITGDVGAVAAISSSELITFTGIGNTITATNSGVPGGDVISFDMDIADLPAFTGSLLPSDEIAINNSGTTERITVAKLLEDIDIPVIPGTGMVVKTGSGPDVWATRTITASSVAGDEGISVVDGDGVSGNPTIGVDIVGLAAAGKDPIATDLFMIYDGTNNLKYTGQEVADGITAILGVSANAYSFITGGDGGTSTAIGNDTVTFNGEGINIVATNAGVGLDTVAFDLDISDLGAGVTVALADVIGVDQGADPNVKFTFTDVVEDLNIPNAITTNGLVTRTAANTYTSRSVAASAVAGDEGISVVNGDGVAGNPTVGVDITGQVAAGANLSATDEFLGYDSTNNVKFTGQEIADGISDIIGGVETTIIDGQPVPTFVDTTRANKILSIETACIPWSRNKINNDDYLKANGDANDADAGWICPQTATLVKATGVTADDGGNTKDINLYVNGALDTASILSFSPTATGQNTDRDITLNIDVAQDDIIHLRGSAAGGEIQDVAVTLYFKWRG